MKHLLLLTAVSLAAVQGVAQEAGQGASNVLEDAMIYAMSPNGVYAVSQGMMGMKIFNLSTGQVDNYVSDDGMSMYSPGIGKCVSDNGIVVGGSDLNSARYWKDGEWYDLPLPETVTSVNLANAITTDGSKICGSIGTAEITIDDDTLMQVPVIWNATDDGYSMPVLLPHPDLDFTGRVPQYITAVDISADGKIVIGQIQNATGMIAYPIIYKENENGEWTYEIVHQEYLNPDGLVFPQFPGDGPEWPSQESFMTEEELALYQDALQAYMDSGYTLPYPSYEDFMTDEEIAAYTAAMAEYNVQLEEWQVNFNAWFEVFDQCLQKAPGYVYNSVKLSADGKTYGCTVGVQDNSDPFAFGYSQINVWVFDTDSDKIQKYDQDSDLNLTYLANDGIALASTSLYKPSNSFVLHAGTMDPMHEWMNKEYAPYAQWMTENMTFEYETYEFNEEAGQYEIVIKEELLSGNAVGTPDLSFVSLSVQNLWDGETDGTAFIFDLASVGAKVESVNAAEREGTVYDLSGRVLKNADAPGIYIIDGKKKVVY